MNGAMGEGRRFRLVPDDPEIGRLPYLWLFYLVFVAMGPVFADSAGDWRVWVASAVSLVFFFPLYFAAYWHDGARRFGIGVAICLIGTALSYVNGGANTYFIFGAYFAGFASRSVREAVVYLGTTALTLVLTVLFVQPSPYFWIPAALGMLVIGLLGTEVRRRETETSHLRMARAEVEALARIAERERIARDLHDLLGQSLSLVSLKAELAQRLVGRDTERALQELADIHQVARQSLSEVRTAVQGYRVGNGAGLRHELDNARKALDAAGVELKCDEDLEPLARELDPEHEAVVALALREGVTNVVRHAAAQTCRVSFVVDEAAFGVEIRDDGRGARRGLGNGLSGMRDRVESLGGRFELSGESGTTIRLLFERQPQEAA